MTYIFGKWMEDEEPVMKCGCGKPYVECKCKNMVSEEFVKPTPSWKMTCDATVSPAADPSPIDMKYSDLSFHPVSNASSTNTVFRNNPDWKYDEEKLIEEFRDYVAKTYGQHYVGANNVQAMDMIASAGHAKGFCIGDIIKYASRYGKKKGQERNDIMKILHYALLLLHFHDSELAP